MDEINRRTGAPVRARDRQAGADAGRPAADDDPLRLPQVRRRWKDRYGRRRRTAYSS
jgi:hypothetical protein